MDEKIYNEYVDGVGTTIVIGEGLEIYNNESDRFIRHVVERVNEVVRRSGTGRGDVKIYLKGVRFMRFSASFVRRVSRGLKRELVDTLGECTIYDLSKSGRGVWNCVKCFVDEETRVRIKLKRREDIKNEQSV
jgi:hypothetical protein